MQEGHLTSRCPLRAQERTSEAIEKLGHQSLQSIDKIVSAQRDIAERVVDIGSEISSEISGAIYELTDAFRFAHAEEMWYAEKQLEVLTGIREAIEYSETITKANALLEIGVKSLKLDMIEESIEKLKEAVKANPLDYRIYITMGHAYLRKDDLENALNRFEYALKTARTNYYKSYTLLLIARAKYCMGKIEEAAKDAKRAVKFEDSQAKVYALQEYGAAKAKLVLATDKFDFGVYNSILEATPIATKAYELATKAKDVALDVREEIEEIGEERKAENFKIKDKIQKNTNMAYVFGIFSILGLIFIIMSFIKWDFGLYLWGAFFGGIATVNNLYPEGGGDIMYHIGNFILGFILAPLFIPLGLIVLVSLGSDMHKVYTEKIKELNETYRPKLERLLDLGEGLKRGETLSVEDWLDKGHSYAKAKSFDTAITCFDSALALDPENEAVWIGKGYSMEELDRNDEAIACCDKALKINSENLMAWHIKGLCLSNLNRIEEALRCYDKALKINPLDERAREYKEACLQKI